MAPTPSRPVSPPLPPVLPLKDMQWMRRNTDRWPTELIISNHTVNEKMWYEWCECEECHNVKYKETVMQSAGYIAFLEQVSKKFHDNLISEVPSNDTELTPLRYVQRIRFWNYETYCKLVGYAWERGEYSEILECFLSKMRMTYRKPAKNLTEWVKHPMLYLILDGATRTHAINLTSVTVIGKRSKGNK